MKRIIPVIVLRCSLLAFPEFSNAQLMRVFSIEYLNYLKAYNQVKTAQKLDIPILILQGERDYQVTMTDFGLWKEGLKNKPNGTFKSYPELNHLFIKGVEKSRPEEYTDLGKVAQYVTNDIAE